MPPAAEKWRPTMRTKTLVTCGQMQCDHNFDGYCQRKNIHITSRDKLCDAFNYRGEGKETGKK